MSKDRRRDRKRRKKKLADQRQKARRDDSLVYMGSKYQTEELMPTWVNTEIGIYETYIMTDRRVVDQTAFAAVETLIRGLRAGTLPSLPDSDEIHYTVGREEDLLIENIRRSWACRFTPESKPSKDKLIGVLRSILGSITKVKSPGSGTRSYLQHIAGFLTKKVGVSVQAYSADRMPPPGPEEDELVRLGRQWAADGELDTRAEFLGLVNDLLRRGQTSRVLDACHLLTGEICDPDSEVGAEISDVITTSRKSIITAMG